MPTMATSLAQSPGCLHLRLAPRRRGAAVLLRFRLRRRLIRLRPPLRAEASPSSDSFSGWSGSDAAAEEDQNGSGFRGLLGAGIAGAFFIAGVSFAALSMRSKNTTGTKVQMEPLSTESAMITYSDNTSKGDGIEDGEVLLDGGNKEDNSLDNVSGTHQDPSFVEVNEDSEGRVDVKHEMGHPLQYSKLVPDGKNVIGEEESQLDDHVGSGGVGSTASDFPSSNEVESSQAAAVPSEERKDSGLLVAENVETHTYNMDQKGTLNREEMLESEVPSASLRLPENQHPVETLTSEVAAIESDDVMPSQEASENVADSASPLPMDLDLEQNSELHNKDESSFPMPQNLEYEREAQMFVSDSNDVPVESGKAGNEGESLANSVSDLNERESELEKQSEFIKSIEPEKSFSPVGIPAPSLLSAALQVPPGKVVVPAAVDPAQGNALAALQVLKVIEPDAQPGELCSRREYARWLVVASNCLSRNAVSKVYPAMYIENVTELAFDDITPEDPDFPCIQGLAEAGLIASKLSRSDMNISEDGQNNHNLFFPDSPLSRQDLVSWKIALDRRQLPEVDRNSLYKLSGYIDIDKINADAWPSLAADLGAGDHSITTLAFGFTRLFQPDKPVTKGQAALALSTGDSAEVVMEELARIEAEKIAEAAVNAHGALVAQVEKDLNASFERELLMEREKIDTLEKLAEEARMELDSVRAEREEEKNALIRGRAAVESEMEVLSKLRRELEEELQSLMSNKAEISFEKNRIEKLQKEIENENEAIVQLQYELQVERKALSMARAWAEEEAKKAREHARALEEARYQWERQGIKVVVDGDLQQDASTEVTWASAGKEHPVDETINRAESLLQKLKSMAAEIKVKSSSAIERLIQRISSFISALKQRAAEATQQFREVGSASSSKAKKFAEELQGNVYAFSSTIGDKSKRAVEDCKESLEKFSHRFKMD